MSRNLKDLTAQSPVIAAAVSARAFTSAIIDGEIVALEPHGHFTNVARDSPRSV